MAGRGLVRNRGVGARGNQLGGRRVAYHGCDPAALEVEGAKPSGSACRTEGRFSSVELPVNLRRPLGVPISIHEPYANKLN